MKPGEFAGGKMNAALKALGFDIVWDVEFAADSQLWRKVLN
jgi:iron only hydrogenase large subunit-like protein